MASAPTPGTGQPEGKTAKPARTRDLDIFRSDEELEDFLAFSYADRHRDLA
jgi:hypothetical protein